MNLYKKSHSISLQGVIQDFEVEGGNKKSNQKMLLKKGQLLFQYPAMDTQSSLKGGEIRAREISPFPPTLYDTLLSVSIHSLIKVACSSKVSV